MQVHRLAQFGASQSFATLIAATLMVAISCLSSATLAQDTKQSFEQIDAYLSFGEFPKAIELANGLPAGQVDEALRRISAAQSKNGAAAGAVDTINKISDDRVRFKALFQNIGGLGQGPFAPRGIRPVGGFGNFGNFGNNGGGNFGGVGNGNQVGQSGGVTEADFEPLIDLIKSTIDPDSWDDANGDGTIQAYPAGVYVDSSGTLHKIKVDAKRSLRKMARRAAVDSGNRSSNEQSELRKISLNRLEKQAQLLAAQGRPISEVMQNLAGIYEIQYLMLLPESNDIVIAGPAGPWKIEADGHAVNVETGKPVLQLDDLVVCLRNAQPAPRGNNGKFGCSITPRKQNLAETRAFVSTSKLKGKAWRSKLRDTLGLQDIEVFGIDASTHAGRVLVEADYRMKLVAMGLESSIPEIPSYLSRLNVGPNGEVEPMDVVRWWFTMNYDEVVADQDRKVFTFTGTGVKVLSENEFINDQGERIHTGQSDGPTAGFARDFTRNFDKIADQYPVYRRLKNVFDLAIVSALIRSQGLDRRANWNLTYFGTDPEYADYVYHVETAAAPSQVESVMNHRVINRRKKNSTVKHTLIGVSGGITFDSMEVLRSKSSVAEDLDRLTEAVDNANQNRDRDHWWWD